MALMSNRSWDEWIAQYGRSHQNRVNRSCHTIGIPMIAVSLPVLVLALRWPPLWKLAAGCFVVGWIFQFVGHAYEHKPPEFLSDWRFLFVGLRWWFAKVRGRA